MLSVIILSVVILSVIIPNVAKMPLKCPPLAWISWVVQHNTNKIDGQNPHLEIYIFKSEFGEFNDNTFGKIRQFFVMEYTEFTAWI